LRTKWNVRIDPEDPDLLFCSVFGNKKSDYRKKRCKRILFCGESSHNVDRSLYDVSLTCEKESEHNLYFPLWIIFINWFEVDHVRDRDVSYLMALDRLLRPSQTITELVRRKSVACSFVVQNPSCKKRINFCKHVQKTIHVECPGKVLQNVPEIGGRGDQIEKIRYLEKCWLNIAFENTRKPGYVTEKLVHGLYSGCIPIYWGGSRSLDFFNKDRFLYHRGMFDQASVIKRMKNLLNDKDEMISMISKPALTEYALANMSPKSILEKFDNIGIV
jgi:hypothetical protein